MNLNTRHMTVSELIETIVPYVQKENYSNHYVIGLKQCFKQFEKYCEKQGITQLTAEVAQQFLWDQYGLQPGTTSRRLSKKIRAMNMLSDFQHCGAIMTHRRLEKVFPAPFADTAEAYFTHMKNAYAQPKNIASHRKAIFRFTDFINNRGVESYHRLNIDNINAFIKIILCNYAKSSAQCYFGILRAFLRYLYDFGITGEDFSQKVISIPRSCQATHLPSTLTIEQIESVLNCIDRESPMGKRDYALLLLASRLGLRASDVRNLKVGDISWESHEIRITQVKTKEPLVLPLPNDVGWAIIDYLKNARPISDAPEIFLRVVPPYISLQNPVNVLIRYMREANIPYMRLPHHGLHILRHSLATHMLDQDIDITTIKEVLGHLNIETTQKYTGISVRQLKECALEVDLVCGHKAFLLNISGILYSKNSRWV